MNLWLKRDENGLVWLHCKCRDVVVLFAKGLFKMVEWPATVPHLDGRSVVPNKKNKHFLTKIINPDAGAI